MDGHDSRLRGSVGVAVATYEAWCGEKVVVASEESWRAYESYCSAFARVAGVCDGSAGGSDLGLGFVGGRCFGYGRCGGCFGGCCSGCGLSGVARGHGHVAEVSGTGVTVGSGKPLLRSTFCERERLVLGERVRLSGLGGSDDLGESCDSGGDGRSVVSSAVPGVVGLVCDESGPSGQDKSDVGGEHESGVGNGQADGVHGDDRHGVGSFGVDSHESGCGPNWARNRKNREAQRQRKLKRQAVGCDWRKRASGASGSSGFWNSCSSELRQQLIDSKARMHIAENDRVAEKAKRQLAVYNANDVEVEVKRYGTGMRASLERSMVSIEKTHGTLVATGNVPGEFHGSAETVVSASSGSISPNSSVSEAEVRKMQKDLLDCNAVIEKFEKRFGVQAAMLDYIDKDIWTENSENDRILDEFCPDGYAKDTSYTPEGKFRLIV